MNCKGRPNYALRVSRWGEGRGKKSVRGVWKLRLHDRTEKKGVGGKGMVEDQEGEMNNDPRLKKDQSNVGNVGVNIAEEKLASKGLEFYAAS